MEFSNLLDEIKTSYASLIDSVSKIVNLESDNSPQKKELLILSKNLKNKINELDKSYAGKKDFYISLDTMINEVLTSLTPSPTTITTPDTLPINPNKSLKCNCETLYNPTLNYNTISQICCINSANVLDFTKCDSFLEFLEYHPVIKKFLYEIDDEGCSTDIFTKDPVISSYDKQIFINNVQLLLNLTDISKGSDKKCIICMALFAYLMKNWSFCKDYSRFRISAVKKWLHELLHEPLYVNMGRQMNPYFDEWTDFFERQDIGKNIRSEVFLKQTEKFTPQQLNEWIPKNM
jgi:hypothetical protein